MVCGGQCRTGLAGCVVLAGRQDRSEQPCECVAIGSEYEGNETKQGRRNRNPQQDFQGNEPLAVSQLSRWATCQVGAGILSWWLQHHSQVPSACAVGPPVCCSQQPGNWGGRCFHYCLGQSKVLRGGLTRVRSHHDVTGRLWGVDFLGGAGLPLPGAPAPPSQRFQDQLPRPPFPWRALRTLTHLSVSSASRPVPGTESVHFEQKSFWQEAGEQT